MDIAVNSAEANLRQRLNSYSITDKDFWSFRLNAVRHYAHAYFQYPAMMVPRLQTRLINSITEVDPTIQTVFDPFVGSGTVMTEAMLQGLNFSGQDINPLAVLLCKAKSGPFILSDILFHADELLDRIRSDTSDSIEAEFPGLCKWFTPEAALDLSRIRRAIRTDSALWRRRFFWVCMAEAIRLTSNSRTSTFKLHIRPAVELSAKRPPPVVLFEQILRRNLEQFRKQEELLASKELLRKGYYTGIVSVRLADATEMRRHSRGQILHDLLITSPPYGDNKTTVPYGQHSYLPLQWIDFEDIDKRADRSCLNTTHELDSRSLGGHLHAAIQNVTELLDLSVTFKRTFEALKDQPRDRLGRVAGFCRDLNLAIDSILGELKFGSYMVWTIGNRRVGGSIVPMDRILEELLVARGARQICRIERPIPSKRMALKNSIAETMRAETIIVMRRV